MRIVKAELSSKFSEIEIVTFSDWHIGDKHCNEADIKAEIKYVGEAENRFVICNGDLMNNATKTSVSDSYSEVITPMEQVERLCELLSPIKDRVLMLTQGNHEARTYRTDGIDLTAIVAAQLGIKERYAREGGILFVRFGKPILDHGRKNTKMTYSLYCTHGSGGGRKEGAKAIRLADMAAITDVDVYIHSHTHLPMSMKQTFYRVNPQGQSINLVEKLFVNTSAKLDYGGYGQTFEYKPSSLSNPIIFLCGKKRKMGARL